MCLKSGILEQLSECGFAEARSQGFSMANDPVTPWFHSNRYSAQAACEHCEGVVRHEPWCIRLDPAVYYAYEIVVDPGKLTMADALILHSLGVLWGKNTCPGNCKPTIMQPPTNA